MKDSFKAFRIHQDGQSVRAGIEHVTLDDLTPGEVVIEVHYSGVNYKDALAGTGKGKIVRRFPLNGGVDLSGIVVSSEDDQFTSGDHVLISGCGLSEIYDGGYAKYVRAPASCVVPIGNSISLYDAMLMGTPALTAAIALYRMQANNQKPEQGSIVVTGATGGVGNMVVDIFSQQGYKIIAITGKKQAADYLMSIGASQVIVWDDIELGRRPLEKAQWAGAVDMLGGETLAWLTRTVHEWGNIASIGLAQTAELQTTVMPFILRGVSILGVSSTNCPCSLRRDLWQRLCDSWKPKHLQHVSQSVITMEDLIPTFESMLARKTQGRVIVDIKAS